VKPLVEYLISRLPSSSPFRNLLVSTSSPQSKNRIALVVSERLVNLPVQIMPPLWKMTIDEVEKARKEVGPGRDLTSREGVGNANGLASIVLQGTPGMDFTHYLLISRVYKMDVGDENIDTAMSANVP
jgi:hypothetical protein